MAWQERMGPMGSNTDATQANDVLKMKQNQTHTEFTSSQRVRKD